MSFCRSCGSGVDATSQFCAECGAATAAVAPQPVQQAPVPLQAKPTNGLAIASLVLGILWLYWIGSILALIFGYKAMRQIDESDGQQEGLAKAGVILGWIGVAFLAITLVVAVVVVAADSNN